MDAELAWGVAVMVAPVLLGLGALTVYFHRARHVQRSTKRHAAAAKHRLGSWFIA
jgi:hypothetical protein